METVRTVLQLVGLGAVILVLGGAWFWWSDERSRARYLASRRDEGSDL